MSQPRDVNGNPITAETWYRVAYFGHEAFGYVFESPESGDLLIRFIGEQSIQRVDETSSLCLWRIAEQSEIDEATARAVARER